MPVTRRQILITVTAVAILIAIAIARPVSPDDVIDYRTGRDEAKAIATKTVTQTMHQQLPQRTLAAGAEAFRSWDRGSRREDGGGPDGFDSVAATYLLRNGVTMRGLKDIFTKRVEAATWTVRFFTPMVREEYFVEVDPREARTIGYHKYQSEKNPGPRLEQPAALAIARNAFATFGVDGNAFDLKEALSYQQPNRRDWLFHFEERQALAAQGFRRISVRVAGQDVTQFQTTVKIPDAVYRAEGEETTLNVMFGILKIVGTLVALALVVTGFVLATRKGTFRWRRPLRWTLILSIVPVIMVLADYESALFGYVTSISWKTFTADLTVSFIWDIGKFIAGLFLALAAIETAAPFASRMFSREARARFGRSALVAAIGAIAIFGIVRAAFEAIAAAAPKFATLRGFNVPETIAMSAPVFVDIAQALYWTIIASGAIAMAAIAVASFPKKPGLSAAIVIAIVFCASLDPGVTTIESPLMLARAAASAITFWLVARYVLNGNLLAWPLAIFLAELASNAVMLVQNHRLDLRVNAGVELAVVAAIAALMSLQRAKPDVAAGFSPPMTG